jgi:hypothetical protein
MPRTVPLLLLVAAVPLAGGCVAHASRLHAVRTAFHRGDLAGADRLIGTAIDAYPRESDVLRLDRAMVALADGRPAEAERLLRTVRDTFDHLEQESPAESVWVMASDDDQKAYAGDDHEKVLVRAMLALSNLVQDGDDAEAYSLQVSDKQRQIVAAAGEDGQRANPKASYRQVALGPYLRGILREETHRHYDDAARSFAQVVRWQPDFPSAATHVARAARGTHSARGHGVVHVFALVGHGPFKAETVELPSTASLAVAGEIVAASLGPALPPTIAPIKVPRVIALPGAVGGLAVSAGDRPAGRTETITDVSQMAVQQQQAVMPQTVGRAVARRTLKKAAIFGAKQGLGLPSGSLPAFAFDVAGVAWEAGENADTRCWGLLPDTIQVLRLELPAGTHTLALQPVDRSGRPAGHAVQRTVTVLDGRNTYVLAQATDAGVLGRPLTNSP